MKANKAAPSVIRQSPRDLGRSLLWPLRRRRLALLATGTALALTAVIPVLGPLVGLGLVTALLHTGFRSLEHTGRRDRADSEPIPVGPEANAAVRSVALLLALLGWSAVALVAATLGGRPGTMAGAGLLVTVLPGAILGVGRERALGPALVAGLDPRGFAKAARIGGRDYALTALVPASIAAAGWGALAIADLGSGRALGLPGLLAGGFLASAYPLLLAFRLAGCLAGRHRRELGYIEHRPAAAAPRPQPEPTFEERVNALIKSDRLAAAADLLRDEVGSSPANLRLWEWYFRVLRKLGDDDRLLAASKDYLTVLLQAGANERAREVIHLALNRDRGFQPAHPDQVFRLARIARADNRPALALRIMHGFPKRCPEHPDTPMVLLFAARILADDFRKPDKAVTLLDTMTKTYADHPLAGEAHRLRQSLAGATPSPAAERTA